MSLKEKLPNCELCDSDHNVTNFYHFDGKKNQWLCWDCREPIIMKRLHGNPDDPNPEPGSTWSKSEIEPEKPEQPGTPVQSQSGISDFL